MESPWGCGARPGDIRARNRHPPVIARVLEKDVEWRVVGTPPRHGNNEPLRGELCTFFTAPATHVNHCLTVETSIALDSDSHPHISYNNTADLKTAELSCQ